ncbi:MAG TPA: 1-deoxy-D-xylulose-5-phosphate synthase [Thermoanaerobaculia bacterium]|nr:1-deoxy-D-xylulose-5-phosphate synthase [Thermoanaerobaculia bacterium]
MSILERIDSPRDLDNLNYDEMAEVASDCRDVIIDTITRRGGHLASNLGAVELTLAIHRIFQSPKDRLIWDTSNQTYTHKLITGRRDQFASIRTPGGLSGFAEPSESEHDTLAAGHAGTGLSYALGVSIATQNDPGEPYVVAIVGDGALTCGTSYEALNNINHVDPKRLVVVFNDNGWSISENVGWLTHWRNRIMLDPKYQRFTGMSQQLLSRFPGGSKAWEVARKIKTSVEGLILPNTIWEELGFRYIGPVDGHNQQELEDALGVAREASREAPVVVHALTHKGHGYPQAEENPPKFHQPGTPSAVTTDAVPRYTYSQVFAKTLIEMMQRDETIVAISAAMLEGTALSEVRRHFPDRVYDVGIAEEHAVIMAAGMAKAGLKPVVSIYSTFLQRSFDQLIHDVALQQLPVTICIDRAGLVGDDGKTHQGVFDIAYTRVVPNMIVSAPKDENELQHLLFTAINSGKPFAIRYPRGFGIGVPLDAQLQQIPIGKGEFIRRGADINFLAYGSMVRVAMEAADALAARNVDAGVVNARFAKPLDETLIEQALKTAPRLVTLEEHLATGGFGSAVLELAERARLGGVIRVHAIADQFIEHGPQAFQRAKFHLDAPGVVDTVLELFPELAQDSAQPRVRRRAAQKETITW